MSSNQIRPIDDDPTVVKRSLELQNKSDENGDIDSYATGDNSNDEVKPEVVNDLSVPRTIGLFGGISFIVGTIIGSGIFISPKGVARGSGSVGLDMISWVVCGVISMLGAFCYAELGTVVRDSGADYAYLHEAFGAQVSFIFSWINNVMVKPASLATITLTCAQYLMTPLFYDDCGEAPVLIKKFAACIFLFILAAVNAYSVKLANRIQIIFTIAKLVALGTIIIGGIVKLCQGYTEHLATGFVGTGTTVGKFAVGLYSGMWAYDGWNTANFMTEEIINPQRNLPLAIIIGVPLVMVVYVLTNISYFTVMSLQELIDSPAVALTWAERVIPNAAWLIPIFVALSTFGTGNGSMCSGGRLIFAAARNDHLPGILAMVHTNKFTPVPAIALSTVLAVLFIIPGDIGRLIDFLSFTMWIFYGMNMLAVIIFQFSKKYKDVKRPVKLPLIIPILAFALSVFLVFVPLISDPQMEYLYAIAFIIVGLIVYIPLVHFKLEFNCTKQVTKFFQLYFQVFKPVKLAD